LRTIQADAGLPAPAFSLILVGIQPTSGQPRVATDIEIPALPLNYLVRCEPHSILSLRQHLSLASLRESRLFGEILRITGGYTVVTEIP